MEFEVFTDNKVDSYPDTYDLEFWVRVKTDASIDRLQEIGKNIALCFKSTMGHMIAEKKLTQNFGNITVKQRFLVIEKDVLNRVLISLQSVVEMYEENIIVATALVHENKSVRVLDTQMSFKMRQRVE